MKRFSFHTLMRSLAMDYTADKQTYGVGDQFLFGPGLMVCPVYNYKARSPEVYFPRGNSWYDFYTGKLVRGGQKVDIIAPLERIGKTDAQAKIIRYNGTKTIVKLK